MRASDPRGRPVYWVGPAGEGADAGEGTDFHAVASGYVSVTPLQVDLTRHAAHRRTSASGSAGAPNDADAAHVKEQSRVSGIGMTSARTRERLVARLREQGITDNEVLERIRSVPRHLFVDEALASRAYEDTALPIGHGQTISQPYIVARMTQSLLEARQAAQGARGRHGLRLPDRRARAAGRDALQRRAHRGAAGQGAAGPARPAHRATCT